MHHESSCAGRLCQGPGREHGYRRESETGNIQKTHESKTAEKKNGDWRLKEELNPKSALTVWGWGKESLPAEVTLFLLGKYHSLFLNTGSIHVPPVNFHSAISISHIEQWCMLWLLWSPESKTSWLLTGKTAMAGAISRLLWKSLLEWAKECMLEGGKQFPQALSALRAYETQMQREYVYY